MDYARYLVANNAETGSCTRRTNGPSGLQPRQCIFRDDALQEETPGGARPRYLERVTKIHAPDH